jgi:hypothetical protein
LRIAPRAMPAQSESPWPRLPVAKGISLIALAGGRAGKCVPSS